MSGAINPWDTKTDDARAAETVNLFVIFCEDAVSEREYFMSFQTDTLKVNPIGNMRWGKLNLYDTIKECRADGLIEFSNNGYRVVPGVTENIWCVYDRDADNNDLALVTDEKLIPWSVSIQTATTAGLKVAWSNDAFELWILLHFEDIAPDQAVHRNYIYDRLKQIFKTIEPRNEDLNRLTENEHFNYKTGFKREKYFSEHVLSRIKPLTQVALARATALAAQYWDNTEFHDRNPCTMVFALVNDLLANGGK